MNGLGFAAMALAQAQDFAVACVILLVVIGPTHIGLHTTLTTLLQRGSEDAYRGRVFSFYDVIFNIAFVSAAAFGAVALPADGFSPTVYAVIALGYAVTSLAYALVTRRLDRRTAPAPGRDPSTPAELTT